MGELNEPPNRTIERPALKRACARFLAAAHRGRYA